jgi:hypothetical protein
MSALACACAPAELIVQSSIYENRRDGGNHPAVMEADQGAVLTSLTMLSHFVTKREAAPDPTLCRSGVVIRGEQLCANRTPHSKRVMSTWSGITMPTGVGHTALIANAAGLPTYGSANDICTS